MIDKFIVEPCEKESIPRIIGGINEYNLSRVPALSETWTVLNYVVKNESGAEIGGILSGIGYWNGLEIKIIWVESSYRNKGIGTLLLKYVEQVAIDKGATISMLDTFDFQAEAFYLKNGYEAIGEIKNFPHGHKRIYFSKRLTD